MQSLGSNGANIVYDFWHCSRKDCGDGWWNEVTHLFVREFVRLVTKGQQQLHIIMLGLFG
jgi:hypothetical protein